MKSRGSQVPGFAVLLAVILLAGGVLAMTAGAADPDEGTVSLGEPRTSWTGVTYEDAGTPIPNGSTALAVCGVPTDDLCDHYDLTVDIPATHWDSAAGGVEVLIAWADESDDFDLYVYDKNGIQVGGSARAGTSSERVFIEDANADDGPYQVRVVPWEVTDSGYTGGAFVESRADVPVAPDEPLSNEPCTNGQAGPFPCSNVDLSSFLPLSSLDMNSEPKELNDLWGWTDPQTGREYAIVGKTENVAFVDVTDELNPVYLGDLERPTTQPVETLFGNWRDIKVYENHAFIGSEEYGHGLQVFDLTKLRGATEPQEWTDDANYSFNLDGPASIDPVANAGRIGQGDNSHNLAINEESGFLYAIGTSTCGGGGPHVVNIQDPKNPEFAGCVSEDGYTHDTQCVNYDGPDPAYDGHEICFNSNEDTLTIVDVTDKDNPVELSRTSYPGATYTHQGWLTSDGKRFIVDDELDEQDEGGQTKSYIFNVESLTGGLDGDGELDPPEVYEGETTSIDHNMYVVEDRVYQANYRSGLRVLDASAVNSGTLSEIGFFDVYPPDDEPEFNGSWSNYPYFDSGIVIVSGIEQGLFVLRPTGAATVPGTSGGDPGDGEPVGGDPGGGEAGGSGGASGDGTGGSGSDQGGVAGASDGCVAAARRASGRRFGGLRLGQSRSSVRRTFGARGTYRRFMDRFCVRGGGRIRIGYPSGRELRGLSGSERRRVRGDAVLILTSSRRTTVGGVRVGMSRSEMTAQADRLRRVRVGRNTWYLGRGSRARLIYKVSRGQVREVGIADRRLTKQAGANRFFRGSR